LHGINVGSYIRDGANHDSDAGRVHNAYAHSDARDCHADRCCKSESNRDRHGDRRAQPEPDFDGESEPEHGADCNSESESYAESYANAGDHEDAGAHVDAHKGSDQSSADAFSDNEIAMIEARVVYDT
jgi:hypothetical protein